MSLHFDTDRGVIEVTQVETWHEIDAPDVTLSIEARPYYCDRGRFVVKAQPKNHKVTVDFADGFPRYYFDWGRMLDEIAAWLEIRGQLVTYEFDPADQTWKATPTERSGT